MKFKIIYVILNYKVRNNKVRNSKVQNNKVRNNKVRNNKARNYDVQNCEVENYLELASYQFFWFGAKITSSSKEKFDLYIFELFNPDPSISFPFNYDVTTIENHIV